MPRPASFACRATLRGWQRVSKSPRADERRLRLHSLLASTVSGARRHLAVMMKVVIFGAKEGFRVDAKTKFGAVILRAKGLCALHRQLSSQRIPGGSIADLDLDDLLRSALVLAVSAMDAYYRDKFLERLIPYIKTKPTVKPLEDALSKAGATMADVLGLLGNKRPRRTLRNKIAKWLLEKPMHDMDQIDALIRGFGIKNLTENSAKKGGAPTLRKKVVVAVKRRHAIVHYSDYYSVKNKPKDIDHDWTAKQVDLIVRLVEQSDAIIDSATS
jgi:hypothetical protein